MRVDGKNLYAFREKINEYYRSLHLTNQTDYLKQHADLTITNLKELSLGFLDELKLLEPFGAGNEEPIFRLEDIDIVNATRMGSDRNHLRLDIRDKKGNNLKLVAFFAPEAWLSLSTEDRISPLVKISENNYNGIKSVEARIVDIDIIS